MKQLGALPIAQHGSCTSVDVSKPNPPDITTVVRKFVQWLVVCSRCHQTIAKTGAPSSCLPNARASRHEPTTIEFITWLASYTFAQSKLRTGHLSLFRDSTGVQFTNSQFHVSVTDKQIAGKCTGTVQLVHVVMGTSYQSIYSQSSGATWIMLNQQAAASCMCGGGGGGGGG